MTFQGNQGYTTRVITLHLSCNSKNKKLSTWEQYVGHFKATPEQDKKFKTSPI
jgi:hypothetical protein